MNDRQKWLAACDILKEMMLRPVEEAHRQAIRDERCCYEFDEVRKLLFKELEFIRGEVHEEEFSA